MQYFKYKPLDGTMAHSGQGTADMRLSLSNLSVFSSLFLFVFLSLYIFFFLSFRLSVYLSSGLTVILVHLSASYVEHLRLS